MRAVLCAALLLLTPIAVYWPTVFHEYGFRDDYAHLRETREVPENLLRFTTSYARPIYGALLVATVRPLGGAVENLQWLRLGCTLLLGLLGIALWRLLARAGWPPLDAAIVGLVVNLLPAAQITVGWSIAWPIALSLLLALAGYHATEAAVARAGPSRSALLSGAVLAYCAAALTYQPSAFFVVVPLGAALLYRDDALRPRAGWAALHLGTAFAGVGAAFVGMNAVFALGFAPAGAMELERNAVAKLGWFLSEPVANALALFVLRDRFATPALFWIAAGAAVALIAGGVALRENRGAADRYSVLFCVLVLPLIGYAVNLAAAVRVAGYRTTYALAGLVVVLVVYAFRRLRSAGLLNRAVHHAVLAGFALTGAVAANRHAYTLIAEPQGWEWAIVRDAVRTLELGSGTRVYIIRPRLEESRATRRTFADEFGSLSTSSDWATAEMFKSALRVRFPNGLPSGLSYTLDSGLDLPLPGAFDAVVDMRKLGDYRRD